MSTITVERRHSPAAKRVLDGLAEACRELGHSVQRWYADGSPSVPRCDLAALWSSPHPKYVKPLEQLAGDGSRVLHIHFGWCPKEATFQIDTVGANGLASWAAEPLDCEPGPALKVREGYLLVALQDGMYVASDDFSPWFSSSQALVAHLVAHSQVPLRFRPHPLDGPTDQARDIVAGREDAGWDETGSFDEAMEGACAVATIHSTCGVDAIRAGLPVLCYGRAVYRLPGVSWPMTSSPLQTWCRTAQLKGHHCDLTAGSQAALLARLRERQWALEDLPGRLEPLLADDDADPPWQI